MSQEQQAQHAVMDKPFGSSSDSTLWISLGVGFLLIGSLAAAHIVSSASDASAKEKAAMTVKVKTHSTSPVYRCADGGVSFSPCKK